MLEGPKEQQEMEQRIARRPGGCVRGAGEPRVCKTPPCICIGAVSSKGETRRKE